MLDYYIATSLENFEQHREFQRLMNNMCNCRCTYDWTQHGSVQKDGVERIKRVAKDEIDGVLSADVVFVLLPGGRGTHTELGIAIGMRRTVFILGTEDNFNPTNGRTCAFYYAPYVHRVTGELEDLRKVFRNWLVDNQGIFSGMKVVNKVDWSKP